MINQATLNLPILTILVHFFLFITLLAYSIDAVTESSELDIESEDSQSEDSGISYSLSHHYCAHSFR